VYGIEWNDSALLALADIKGSLGVLLVDLLRTFNKIKPGTDSAISDLPPLTRSQS
jgi:hypothetical protein